MYHDGGESRMDGQEEVLQRRHRWGIVNGDIRLEDCENTYRQHRTVEVLAGRAHRIVDNRLLYLDLRLDGITRHGRQETSSSPLCWFELLHIKRLHMRGDSDEWIVKQQCRNRNFCGYSKINVSHLKENLHSSMRKKKR